MVNVYLTIAVNITIPIAMSTSTLTLKKYDPSVIHNKLEDFFHGQELETTLTPTPIFTPKKYICNKFEYSPNNKESKTNEMVEIISAQSIGEPLTQAALTAFHYAGKMKRKAQTVTHVAKFEKIAIQVFDDINRKCNGINLLEYDKDSYTLVL